MGQARPVSAAAVSSVWSVGDFMSYGTRLLSFEGRDRVPAILVSGIEHVPCQGIETSPELRTSSRRAGTRALPRSGWTALFLTLTHIGSGPLLAHIRPGRRNERAMP